MTDDWQARFDTAIRQLDQMEAIVFLGGVRALASGRITFEDFERDIGRIFAKHRSGEAVTVADLPVEWGQPN